MSDFLYSSVKNASNDLRAILCELTWRNEDEIDSFEGAWGSLAVTRNRHRGYRPFQDESHIACIAGAPLLGFQAEPRDPVPADCLSTARIVRRLRDSKAGLWKDELLTPFCFLHIEKDREIISVVTDRMSFIPAYCAGFQVAGVPHAVVSTHCDAVPLAMARHVPPTLDRVSVCDLIHKHYITFPHTLFKEVFQLYPATVHSFQRGVRTSSDTYWEPSEYTLQDKTLSETAHAIGDALARNVELAADYYGELGLLLSGGEDSRAIACMAPEHTRVTCVTVGPSKNREFRIASRVARSLRYRHLFIPIHPAQYFHDLGRRTLFNGSNGLGRLAHLVGIVDTSPLLDLPVVLGGFKADTFLKGYYLNRRKLMRGVNYQYVQLDGRPGRPPTGYPLFSAEVWEESDRRHAQHWELVRELRPRSVGHWIKFWPMSQDHDIVHYWSNRRLFAAEEIFMTPEVVEASRCVPDAWQLNRKLFWRATNRYLQRLWWIPHSDGHYPAFPWYANLVAEPVMRVALTLKRRWFNRGEEVSSWPALDEQFNDPMKRDQTLLGLTMYCEALGISEGEVSRFLAERSVAMEDRYALVQVLATLSRFSELGWSIS